MLVKLEDIADVKAGGTPSRTKKDYWNGDIKWLKIADVKSKYISKTKETITELGLEKSSTKMFEKGTIIYTIFATLGEVAILTERMATNQAIAGIKILDENQVYSDYLYFYLISIKKDIMNMGRGVAQNNINLSILRNIEIPLPPLTKQKAIAKKLDKAKELIELRKASIKKLDELSKSVFVDMFGEPVENPKGWKIVKLSHYGNLARGKSSHRPRNAPELYNGKYPFIQTGDVSNGNNIYLSKYKQTYSELGIQQSRLFYKGIIAIAIAANIGNAKILNFDSYFPDSVVGFQTECPEFSLFLLSFYKNQLDNRATKTAQKNINLKILNDLDVIEVPLDLQNKFAKTIQKIEAQKALYEEALEKLEYGFEALLSESFG